VTCDSHPPARGVGQQVRFRVRCRPTRTALAGWYSLSAPSMRAPARVHTTDLQGNHVQPPRRARIDGQRHRRPSPERPHLPATQHTSRGPMSEV
jgi:hypothetical protein